MAQPQKLVPVASTAVFFVTVAYITIALGLLALYPYVTGDIISNLHSTSLHQDYIAFSIIPFVVRSAFVVVLLLSSPLVLLPCGELVEGKVIAATHFESTPQLRAIVRFAICGVCLAISIAVPGFVTVLSFVGCFSSASASFVLPPLMHLMLSRRARIPWNRQLRIDMLMFLLGVFATVLTTVYTIWAAT